MNLKYIRLVIPKNKSLLRNYIICFPGLSGSIVQLVYAVMVMVNNGYDVILPLYGPGQLSLDHSLSQTEYDYCDSIIKYLNVKKYDKIHIFAWSLGGIKYLCFDDVLRSKSDHDIEIKAVYLFEPLLTSRALIDVYFSRNRTFSRVYGSSTHAHII